jgi:hypothetical protein
VGPVCLSLPAHLSHTRCEVRHGDRPLVTRWWDSIFGRACGRLSTCPAAADTPAHPPRSATCEGKACDRIQAYCYICYHLAVLSADRWPDDLPVPWFKPRMVCTGWGIIGEADVRANWKERSEWPTLTGEQWQ